MFRYDKWKEDKEDMLPLEVKVRMPLNHPKYDSLVEWCKENTKPVTAKNIAVNAIRNVFDFDYNPILPFWKDYGFKVSWKPAMDVKYKRGVMTVDYIFEFHRAEDAAAFKLRWL